MAKQLLWDNKFNTSRAIVHWETDILLEKTLERQKTKRMNTQIIRFQLFLHKFYLTPSMTNIQTLLGSKKTFFHKLEKYGKY